MEINFKIAKFKLTDENFVKTGYDEYQITYLIGPKWYQLRIVVNGYLTKEIINLSNENSGYKDKNLLAIKEYIEIGHLSKNKVSKRVTLPYLETIYSAKIIHNIKTYLLPINKEGSRDRLTALGLINI